MSRLHGRERFLAIRQHAIRTRSGAVSVAFLPDAAGSDRQVGFAVSRRLGNAVVRNRLRRRLRAAMTDLIRTRPDAVGSGAYLLTPRSGAGHLSFAQLATSVSAAVEKSQRAALPASSVR